MASRPPLGVLYLLFFVSGLSALVYEVVWFRLLGFVMGNTVLTVTTVLATFMGGLALGSHLGGRVADGLRRPVRAYAILELVIGVLGVLVPALIRLLRPLHAAAFDAIGSSELGFGAAQFVLAGAVLLVPTTCMGATLPILSKHGVRSIATVGGSVGRLYAVNTFGAVAGAFLTGFLLMPGLGSRVTIAIAAALNLAIAAAAFWLDRSAPAPASATAHSRSIATSGALDPPAPPPGIGPLLVAFALVGFASMVDQVAWTRVLSLVLGSSVYAFSLMVGTFILGLALGGAAIATVADRVRRPALALSCLQAGVAASCAVLVPVLGLLPDVVLALTLAFGGGGESFLEAYLLRFGLVLACLIVPTALMGAAFPLVTRIAATSEARVGRTVGSVYAANTLGAIAGSFAGGFVLVPLLGLRGSLLGAAGLNLAVAAILVFVVARARGEAGPRPAAASIGAGALALVLVTLLSPWDASRLSSGVYLYAIRYRDQMLSGETPRDFLFKVGELVHYDEGLSATVSVRRVDDVIALVANGKTDASTSYDMQTQVLLAHIPAVIAKERGSALVIGVASGITAGSVACHPFERIDGVEISPEIVDAAKRFFSEHNHGVFDDERFRLSVADGRTFVDLAKGRYDVVNNQPSNLWIAGIGNLFTREFFEAALEKLLPGGLVAQWVSVYDLRPDDFRTVVRTFGTVFPHVSLWELQRGADYLLVGSLEAHALDVRELRSRLAEEAVAADLARVGIVAPEAVAARFIASGAKLEQFTGDGPVNTDDNGLLEYAAPRLLHRRMSEANVAALDPILEPIETIARGEPDDVAKLSAAVDRRRRARADLNAADRLIADGRAEEALFLQESALAALPEELAVREAFAINVLAEAEQRLARGDAAAVLMSVARVDRADPGNVDAIRLRGHALLALGKAGESADAFERVVRLRPRSSEAVLNLSSARLEAGQLREARAAIDEFAAAGGALDADLHYNRGCVLLRQSDYAAAVREFEDALRLRPGDAAASQALDTARRLLRGEGGGGAGGG